MWRCLYLSINCLESAVIILQELLAFCERIGTVNTGLSDAALSECLERSLYVQMTSCSNLLDKKEEGDIKCIVCQVIFVYKIIHRRHSLPFSFAEKSVSVIVSSLIVFPRNHGLFQLSLNKLLFW